MKKYVVIFMLITSIAFADSWKKEIINKVIEQKNLKMTSELIIYTGNKIQNDITHNAPIGMKYILVPFKVQKNGTEKEIFDSKKLLLIIGDKEFQRVGNDSFLEKFSIKSFPKLRIKLGTHEGMIAYKIPEDSDVSGAYLKYNEEIIKLKNN